MRVDGRTADQMRPLKITPDFISTAEGSVLIELGNTRVICTATVDDGVPGFLKTKYRQRMSCRTAVRVCAERAPSRCSALEALFLLDPLTIVPAPLR